MKAIGKTISSFIGAILLLPELMRKGAIYETAILQLMAFGDTEHEANERLRIAIDNAIEEKKRPTEGPNL